MDEAETRPTVISLRRTSGRLADRRMRSNFNLFLYESQSSVDRSIRKGSAYLPLSGVEPLIS